MAYVGEIIAAPQGLAVVVSVLPTTVNVGGQVLSQAVASPLTGGPSAPAPASATPSGAANPFLAAQAAATFVALVLDTPDPGSPTTAPAGGAGGGSALAALPEGPGGPADSGAPQQGAAPTAFASAAQAYQATAKRGGAQAPQIVLIG